MAEGHLIMLVSGENARFIFLLTLSCLWLCQVTDAGRRSRDHIGQMLHFDQFQDRWTNDEQERNILDKLNGIYKESIQPTEEAYQFRALQRHVISEGEMYAKPMVLFLGPWSTGKTTMINYLLGIEGTMQLYTGAEPTTRDFTVITHGPTYKTTEGMVLLSDQNRPYTPLQKFGMGFSERLTGIELPSKLLERVTIIDTPGIIENRKQQERGYPFNDVCQWLIDRAALIIVVFDPTKLDVGTELDKLFQQLKGKESQIRMVLNKADSVQTQELMRVYGALFWSLAPSVHLVEPPRLYVGSFWQKPYRENTTTELFFAEELSLLNDLNQVVKNHIEKKISFYRQHAILVRIHALLVDKYLTVYKQNKGLLFGDNEKLKKNIINKPEDYNIYKEMLAQKDISRQDLPSPDIYRDFFSIHSLDSFSPIRSHCPLVMGKCMMTKMEEAINIDIPQLLLKYQKLFMKHTCDGNCQERKKSKQDHKDVQKSQDKPKSKTQVVGNQDQIEKEQHGNINMETKDKKREGKKG